MEPILPHIPGQQLDAAAMREAIAGVDAVIAGDDQIDASVLEAGKASRLKAVIKWGIGTDSIDKVKAAELGIPVYNTPGTFANEVADLAISLLLNVAAPDPSDAQFDQGRRLAQGAGAHAGRHGRRRHRSRLDRARHRPPHGRVWYDDDRLRRPRHSVLRFSRGTA